MLLGAGASADCGYPLGADLAKRFSGYLVANNASKDILSSYERLLRAFQIAQAADRRNSGSIEDVARRLHGDFLLEDFFSFWDAAFRNTQITSAWPPLELFRREGHVDERRALSEIHTLSVDFLQDQLAPRRTPARYLDSLLSYCGPFHDGPTIVTLNFDLEVERTARMASLDVLDGFEQVAEPPSPPSWEGELKQDWKDIHETYHVYTANYGKSAKAHGTRLVKLHGSIGWMKLEEGSGSIGQRHGMRENVELVLFRRPYGDPADLETLWNPFADRELKFKSGRSRGPKRGVVFARPALSFGDAVKIPAASIIARQFATFVRLLDVARRLVVIGYGWRDDHVNSAILQQVHRGIELWVVGPTADQDVEHIIRHRMPTSARGDVGLIHCLIGSALDIFERRKAMSNNGSELELATNHWWEQEELSSATRIRPWS